jgi:cobalt/nickel transport system permease protein
VSLFAVHISDGVLSPWYLAIGFALTALLLVPAILHIGDEEIPRIGLLTAAFFVASSIHVKTGVASVHLLLNGLVGVILGRRAPLAILVALTLQAFLIGHGGYTAIGVNAVVMTVPALVAWAVFAVIAGTPPPSPRRAACGGAMAGGLAVLLSGAIYALVVVVAGVEDFRIVATLGFAVHIPLAVIEAIIVGVAAGYLARVKPAMLGAAPRL